MKTITVILIFFMTTSYLNSQSIEISEAPRTKDNGTYNSFLCELPDVEKQQAEADWKKYIAYFKGSKTKYDRKKKLFVTTDVKMPRLNDETVDVFARIIEDSNPNKHTTVIIWFESGNSYISSRNDSLKGLYAKEIVLEYAMTTSKHHAESIVKNEDKRLAELEKDLKELKRANKDYHETIDKAIQTISQNEKNIEINELDQKNKAKDIEVQLKVLAAAKENVKKFVN